jgi:hypothetical protein
MTLIHERVAIRVGGSEAPQRKRWSSGSLRAVLLALPFAALTELLLMRTFYRVGIFIPKEGSFRTVYALLTSAGSFAFNLASVLALAALGLLAVPAFRHGDRRLGMALAAFLAAVLAARVVGAEAVGPLPRLAFALAILAIVSPFLRSGADAAHRILVASVTACLMLSTYAGIAQGPGVDGAPGVSGAQIVAELLVVVASAAAAAAWLRTDRFRLRPPLVAAPLAASFLAGWTANASVIGILVLWTAGLRLYLAPWIYAIALWAFLVAAIGWLRDRPWRSAGLVLLLAAGLFLGSTYQQTVGLVSMVLLTDGVAFGGLPMSGGRRRPKPRALGAGERTVT